MALKGAFKAPLAVLCHYPCFSGAEGKFLHHNWEGMDLAGYCGRSSSSADFMNTVPAIPTHTAKIPNVFRFQCFGSQNQPPAGDQTSLGYV
ncbi:hypothetical protein BSKO_08431 [Bryopsis sp. KO-2023]|nr:hypothetical protein BSKO_08431 [Bryopsis sp. KO-2023]